MKKKLSIPEDFKLNITYRNPMFNKTGTYSYPVSIHKSDAKKFGFPHSIEKPGCNLIEAPVKIKMNGLNILNGNLIITESNNNWYQYHLEAGKGQFAALIKEKYLTDIEENIKLSEHDTFNSQLYSDLSVYKEPYPTYNFVFFPIYMPNFVTSDENYLESYPDADILNKWDLGNNRLYYCEEDYPAGGTWINFIYQTAPQYFLCYVIKKVFHYFGYKITRNDIESHPELSQLVIFNSNTNHIIDSSYYIQFSKDLPRISISKFILGIEVTCGAVLFFNDVTKEIQIILKNNIVIDTDYNDITKLSTPYYTKKFSKESGLELSLSKDDSYLSNNLDEKLNEGLAVEDFSDLPMGVVVGEIILVKNQNKFYKYSYIEEEPVGYYDWVFHSHQYQDHIVGNRNQKFEGKAGTLMMENLDRDTILYIPHSETERRNHHPYVSAIFGYYNDPVERTDFTMLFYRGVVSGSPYASSGVFYINEAYEYSKLSNANIALIPGSKYGIVEQLYKNYFHWLININQEVTRKLNLLPKHIEQLDFSKKYRIGNTNYFINSIPVTYTPKNIEIGEVSLLKA